RSLLQLYASNTILFPQTIKTFLKETNLLRELDVFLLSINQKSDKKVFKQLTSLRNKHYKALFTEESKTQIFQSLNDFYDFLTNLNPSFNTEKLIRIAHEDYDENVRLYSILPQPASKKELHTLRIRFKISRYALEFLHDSALEDTHVQLEESKRFQDTLGEIHDLYNQIKLLKKLHHENPSKELKELLSERKKMLKRSKSPVDR
ncbi:MAG: CHAD domain-containing protein, partial [Sulfuricurvum sp.]|nr:CHAD domain-containing protein [Sulfuricurvum sp.]